jgi:hypothetical protein
VKKEKNPMPPCGAYNINWKPVDRKFKPLSWTNPVNRPKIVKEKVEPDMRLIELEKEKRGFIDFDRFKDRSDFYKM